jgi:general secretion pathway protein F
VILLACSDFLRQDGWLVAVVGVVSAFFLRRHVKTPHGREQYDRFILKIPVVGRVVKIVAISRFTKTLAALLGSGVPILTAMEIVQQVVENKVLEEVIQEARVNIREGEGIAIPLRRSGLFPPLVTHMIAIGEKSGKLEGMLQKVSEAYDNEVETAVTGLTSLLAPVMILGMGLVVLFIVLAILLPIFEISQVVN